MPTYTRSNLTDDLGSNTGSVYNFLRILNRAARFVVSDIDLRSTKRRAYLSPVLHEDLFDYQAPSDLKEQAIIDVRRIADRTIDDKFNLVTSEYFDRHKEYNKNLIAIEDRDFLKKLRISVELRSEDGAQALIHEMDSLTADGTWSTTLDASNLTLDEDVFVMGEASLNFDMDQAGTTTTAGYITNSDFDDVDLSGYEDGSVFVFVYAPTITGLDGFTLRIGNDASNYFSKQVTVTNENLAFHTGWMLLRFDLATATETGTVDFETIDYVRLAIDKGNDSLESTDWRVDYIIARRGIQHEVWYYTKYPWQTSAGVYIENSTATGDLLNCDTEEYELFILKGKELIAQDLKEFDDMKEYARQYKEKKENYESNYKSERLLLIQKNYNFKSNPHESWLD